MAKQFTKEEEIRLVAIASKPKNEWAPLLNKMANELDRSYGSVWQKAYAISLGEEEVKRRLKAKIKRRKKAEGTTKVSKKTPKEKVSKKAARKDSGVIKSPTRKPYTRKSHKSPLSSYMTVSPNEVRFPIQGIRIEGGELIVTFK